jgi:hypothetical protein
MARGARNPVQMRSRRAAVFFLIAAASFGASAGAPQAGHKALAPVVQPIAFSHKQHCEKNIPCVLCHHTATSGDTAGLPAAAVCMTCHQSVAAGSQAIRKVASYARQHKPIPWVRVYRIQDFVFFSHQRHGDAKVACSACHGQICQSEVLKQEITFSMKFCVGCHKAEKASVKCDACHTLSM